MIYQKRLKILLVKFRSLLKIEKLCVTNSEILTTKLNLNLFYLRKVREIIKHPVQLDAVDTAIPASRHFWGKISEDTAQGTGPSPGENITRYKIIPITVIMDADVFGLIFKIIKWEFKKFVKRIEYSRKFFQIMKTYQYASDQNISSSKFMLWL